MLSVGIDIGTSTTQLVFSELTVENRASSYSVPKMVIADKRIIYKSDIYFTPLISPTHIDADAVRKIVESEYKKAGTEKSRIDTGAVIITGETARKDNASIVLKGLSDFAGDFVVATAGADLESIISAKGAGTDVYSKENRTTAVNIDIGGGTSNLAVFKNGNIADTGCMDIGGRLIKIDRDTKKITYITDKLQKIIDKLSLDIKVGMKTDEKQLMPIIKIMTAALEKSVGIENRDEIYNLLETHRSVEKIANIECISFSGGVADCIYNDTGDDDIFKYGDIGILLGREIQKSELCKKLKLIKAKETIRATVVGAGSHTTEISGSTITYTKDIFPLKNLPILKLSDTKEESIGSELKRKLEWYRTEDGLDRVAIAFEGHKNPTFSQVSKYADEIAASVKEILCREMPIVVIVENDMAKALGQSLYVKLGYNKDIICIDGVKLDNGDYIDIGKPIAGGMVLPVVIKTLVFN